MLIEIRDSTGATVRGYFRIQSVYRPTKTFIIDSTTSMTTPTPRQLSQALASSTTTASIRSPATTRAGLASIT
jgi:hypothetical protein